MPRPDPGSTGARRIAFWMLLVFFGVTFYLQQEKTAAEPRPAGTVREISPPAGDPNVWMAKMAVKLSNIEGAKAGGGPSPGLPLLGQLEDAARSDEEKVRVAIVAGELDGPEAALNRLHKVVESHPATEESPAGSPAELNQAKGEQNGRAPVESGKESPAAEAPDGGTDAGEPLHPDIAKDIAALELIYGGRAGEVTDDQKAGLAARHGWFGRLALVQGVPPKDPARVALVGGGEIMVVLLFLIGAGFVLLFLTGLGMLVFFIVKLATGKLRSHFVPPAPGGSVYLETVAAFVAAFVIFQLVLYGLLGGIKHMSGPATAAVILSQWILLAAVFWPMARGVGFSELRAAIGWHSGRGVLREIGAGLAAYLAGIPILVVAAITAIVLVLVWEVIKKSAGMAPSPPPENPVVHLLGGNNWWAIAAFALLATVWAPIVEEAIFRGCLFRHARARVNVAFAAIASALVFGGMHGYPGPLLLPVMSLGLVFALMREWRGSLIASMTAHCVHNAMVTTVLLTFVALLGD